MNGLGPKYISDLLVQYETSRCLRSSGGDLLRVPGVRNKQGEATFSYYAPLLWNTFPGHMRKAVTLSSFKSGYKTLFTLAFQ